MQILKPLGAGLLALMLGFSLAHCGDPEPDDKKPPATEECDKIKDPDCVQCEDDTDCGDDQAFFRCDLASAKCVPACSKKADCSNHPAANGGALEGCAAGLGCVCDERKCVPQACTADSECGAQVCKGGQCVAPETGADSCKIFPEFAVLRAGFESKFVAVGYKAGNPLVLGEAGFEWSSADASKLESKGAGAFEAKAASSNVEQLVKVTVKGGAASCTARVRVFGAPPAGDIRVVVVDELTSRLVPGAQVMVGNVGLGENATDKGVHTGTVAGSAPLTISVFHDDYSYVTLVGVDGTNKDLLIPIRRNPGEKVGGYKGKFTNLAKTGDIHFGLAGTSIPGSLTDLDFSVLVGPLQPTDIVFSGNKFNAPLPSGSVIGLGQSAPFKGEFQSLAVPGECGDEDKTASGSCGTRSAWSLMGDIPISKLPISELTSGVENLNIGKLLASLLPLFKNFKSGVHRDVEFAAKAPPGGDATKLFTDNEAFVTRDLAPATNLALKSTVFVPDLPVAGGSRLDSAIVLAGSLVKGRGVVPLGLTAGLDTDDKNKTPDGKVVGDSGNDGKLTLRMAPNHSGIEGSNYAVVTLGLSIDGFMSGARMAMSGLVKYQSALPFGTDVKYEGGFLGFSDAGAYDFRKGEYTGAKAVPGATVHRAVFRDRYGRTWAVYFKGTGFTLPEAPSSFGDRTLLNAPTDRKSVGPRSPYSIQALTAKVGSGAVDMDKLFAFNATNATDLVEFTHAFSVYDFGAPELEFTEPANCLNGCEVPGNQIYKVKVSNFTVPADGLIELRALQNGLPGMTVLMDTLINGTANMVLPSALAAGTYDLEVRLLKADRTPIDPVVASTIKVTVK